MEANSTVYNHPKGTSPTKQPTQSAQFSPQKQSQPTFQQASSPTRSLQQTTTSGFVDIRLLLEKIKNHVKLGQLRVDEYFKDFDPLRKGIITSNKFRGVLSKMK